MRARARTRVQALFTAAVLLALSSGLPSHHHESPDPGPQVVDGGHHGHGVILTDPGDRLKSELGSPGLPSETFEVARPETAAFEAASTPAAPPDARARPPSSDRPRAPPVAG